MGDVLLMQSAKRSSRGLSRTGSRTRKQQDYTQELQDPLLPTRSSNFSRASSNFGRTNSHFSRASSRRSHRGATTGYGNSMSASRWGGDGLQLTNVSYAPVTPVEPTIVVHGGTRAGARTSAAFNYGNGTQELMRYSINICRNPSGSPYT